MSEPRVRILTDPATGHRYSVRIAPRERRGGRGVDWRLNALVFETDGGGWVGSVPVDPAVRLTE